jgi:hypothetical protein
MMKNLVLCALINRNRYRDVRILMMKWNTKKICLWLNGHFHSPLHRL